MKLWGSVYSLSCISIRLAQVSKPTFGLGPAYELRVQKETYNAQTHVQTQMSIPIHLDKANANVHILISYI